MIWKERRVLLAILGLLLAANVVFFFTYRVQYQSRLNDLDDRLKVTQASLDQTRAARVRAEQTYRSYKQIEADVEKIYNEVWSTQPQRLTAMIIEIKRLTVASSLVPTSVGYAQTEVAVKAGSRPAAGSARRSRSLESIGVNEVGISFGVSGTYDQVRRLINLLELSRQFVIIDQMGLSTAEGNNLSFSLHVKTLFRDEKPPVANSRL